MIQTLPSWKKVRAVCEICGQDDHHTLLHRHNLTFVSEVVDTVFVDQNYKKGLVTRHTSKCTLRQAVAVIRNPETGSSIKCNCLLDGCCAYTQCDIGIAKYLGLSGKKIKNITHGAGGIVHESSGILAEVTIQDLTGTTSVTHPIRFIDHPAGQIQFFDWRSCQNRFDFLRDIPLPSPVSHEGMPPIPLIIGTDLNCLMRLKPGSVQLGAFGPMSPLAEETEIGWTVSGYTGPDAPTSAQILSGDALVLESNVVLSRSQPNPFHIDEDSIFLSPRNPGNISKQPEDEEEIIEDLLDCVAVIATEARTLAKLVNNANDSTSPDAHVSGGSGDNSTFDESESALPFGIRGIVDELLDRVVESVSEPDDFSTTKSSSFCSSKSISFTGIVAKGSICHTDFKLLTSLELSPQSPFEEKF